MPFEPINERHAIHEVVFVLGFERGFSEEEIEAIAAAHDRWKAELPGINRPQVLQVMVGAQARPPAGTVVGPVQFTSHKRDGSLDWRLLVENNIVVVNCLTYTRWKEVWERARRLIMDAVSLITDEGNRASSIALQYIDIFQWQGAETDYRIDQLLRKDSPHVPTSLWDAGPLWHLHLGWFRTDGLPADGRLLERTHLDGQQMDQGSWQVKIDNTLRLDLDEPVVVQNHFFSGDQPFVDKVLPDLHLRNKELLTSFLTVELAQRIDLNA